MAHYSTDSGKPHLGRMQPSIQLDSIGRQAMLTLLLQEFPHDLDIHAGPPLVQPHLRGTAQNRGWLNEPG